MNTLEITRLERWHKLPLKARFWLLILLTLTISLGLALPFLFFLKNRYEYYSLESKGLYYSKELMGLVDSLLIGKYDKARELMEDMENLTLNIGADIIDKKDWEAVEAKLGEWLAKNSNDTSSLFKIIAKISSLDYKVFENSRAIADPDRAAINLLVAHYINFPVLTYAYLRRGFVPEFLKKDYLKNYFYAFKFKPELKEYLGIKQDYTQLNFLSLLGLDRKSLAWVWEYTLKRKKFYELIWVVSVIIFLLSGVSIICLVVSVKKTIFRGIEKLNFLASKMEAGDFSFLENKMRSAISYDEYEAAINRIAKMIFLQGQMLEKIKSFAESLSKGRFELVEIEGFKGIYKDTFQALNKTVYTLVIVVRRIKSMVIALKLGVPKRVDERGLEGVWEEILLPLNSVAQRLEEINTGISITLENISKGVFKVEIPRSRQLKGIYKEILTNLEKLVESFLAVITEISHISSAIAEGNLDIDINVEKFKGEYRSLIIMLQKIIERMKDQVEEIKRMWQEEEELLTFKQTVEEDQEIEIIYFRIKELLINKFGVKAFSFYEVNPSQNYLHRRISFPEGKDFCNPEIFINADLCRTKKTAMPVWGEEAKWGKVCPMFQEDKKCYICYPFMFEEGVRFVLQIVCDSEEEYKKFKNNFSAIKRYIENVIPVIQVKKFARYKGEE